MIKRRDTGEWAIPGGMVDEGEMVSETLRREFAEVRLIYIAIYVYMYICIERDGLGDATTGYNP